MLFILPALLAPAAVIITRGEAAKPLAPPSLQKSTITVAGVAIDVAGREWKTTVQKRVRVDGLTLTGVVELRRPDGGKLILGDPGAAGQLPREWATPRLAKVARAQALRTPISGGTAWLFATEKDFLVAICRTEEDACRPLLEQVAEAPARTLLSPSAHRVLNSSLRRLDSAIASTAAGLRSDSADKRARAAEFLADRARAARKAVLRSDAGVLDEMARAGVARALETLSDSARRCGRAAGRGDAAAWRSCVRQMQRADEGVADAVAALRRSRSAVTVSPAVREIAAPRRIGRLPSLRPRAAKPAATAIQQPSAQAPIPSASSGVQATPQSGGGTQGSATGGGPSAPIVVGPEG